MDPAPDEEREDGDGDRGATRLAHALVFATPALWAVNYLVARLAPGIVAPHALALGRWTVAAAVLAAFCWPELVAKRSHVAREWRRMLVLGALGMWVCGAFVYIGGRDTTALNIGLLYAAAPVLIAIGSTAWLGERLGAREIAGAGLAIAGVLHILAGGDWSALARLALRAGDLWVAVAVACWVAYSLLLRAWPSAFGPLARLTLTAVGGVVVLVPFAIWEAVAWLPSELSWRSAGLVVVAALLPGVGAYGAYSFMQSRLGAARVGLVQYLGPLWAALLAWLVLGESIALHHVLGAALILPGIALATLRRP